MENQNTKNAIYFTMVFLIFSIFWLAILLYYTIDMQKTIDKQNRKIKTQNEIIDFLEESLRCKIINYLDDNKSKYVTATVYNAEAKQCNADYLHTASMFKLSRKDQYKHRIIAVSRDLLKDYPFGTKVRITGTHYDGIWTIQDVMNKRYKNRIDLLINKGMRIGKWENCEIKKL